MKSRYGFGIDKRKEYVEIIVGVVMADFVIWLVHEGLSEITCSQHNY